MSKKQPEKKFKTIVYVFLSQNGATLAGQKINKQLESENTTLWDLISSKFPENYLSKTEFFTVDDEVIISGKHSFGSKKVVSLRDFMTASNNNPFSTFLLKITDPDFCTNFVDYFEQDKSAKKISPGDVKLVIQKVAA